MEAIRSLKAKLSCFSVTPPNGLALFCGYSAELEGSNTKKFIACFEPFLPLRTSLYRCDKKFHTELLREQISSGPKIGFIIIDGNATSFHVLNGSSRETIFKLEKVSLPKKHGRGGQSQNRFAHIREEKIGWYISKIAELARKYFIDSSTNTPNVEFLIVAGSADLKHKLIQNLDAGLAKIIMAVLDVQYGGEVGFHEAVNLSQDKLQSLKYVQEKQVIGDFFEIINRDGLYVIGVEDVMYALDCGALETLLLWDSLEYTKYVYEDPSGCKQMKYCKAQATPQDMDPNWKLVHSESLIDWILQNYKNFGAKVQLVSDQSSLGSQFVKGFGGVGGVLRYSLELPSATTEDEDLAW